MKKSTKIILAIIVVVIAAYGIKSTFFKRQLWSGGDTSYASFPDNDAYCNFCPETFMPLDETIEKSNKIFLGTITRVEQRGIHCYTRMDATKMWKGRHIASYKAGDGDAEMEGGITPPLINYYRVTFHPSLEVYKRGVDCTKDNPVGQQWIILCTDYVEAQNKCFVNRCCTQSQIYNEKLSNYLDQKTKQGDVK